MSNRGPRLEEGEQPAARERYERAVAAGHTGALIKLGELVEDDDPQVARRKWYERAATAHEPHAMFLLG
jgi:hypothetical protein